eukprot:CAMPEP_0181216202 /NCGR_PEP_ID=MMETSP1096-20121128/26448_1 /TAXON_ID=156174 ORGANISM="Chrysochromulina ericina, Strain CCMP281" /NCGR_SAMPLE_ID=MMETSP1096 /ASSEMBLY_ACC=CAM_ASM_000453 /LENGTH=204 /DNA_ID=CAMNT_0023308163 /DNA_START=503 /DNA_END=1118 /DNA_ORIENTATION=-
MCHPRVGDCKGKVWVVRPFCSWSDVGRPGGSDVGGNGWVRYMSSGLTTHTQDYAEMETPCAPREQCANLSAGRDTTCSVHTSSSISKAEQAVGAARLRQRRGCVVMAIFTTNIVKLLGVRCVSALDGRVPLSIARPRDDRISPHAAHHEVVYAYIIRPLEVVDPTDRVSDPHVTNARNAACDRRQRAPDDGVRETVIAAVDGNG